MEGEKQDVGHMKTLGVFINTRYHISTYLSPYSLFDVLPKHPLYVRMIDINKNYNKKWKRRRWLSVETHNIQRRKVGIYWWFQNSWKCMWMSTHSRRVRVRWGRISCHRRWLAARWAAAGTRGNRLCHRWLRASRPSAPGAPCETTWV